MISRNHLDSFTLPKLHKELRHFGVTDPPLDHLACVDMIMNLLERKVPRKNTMIQQTLEAEGMPDSPVSSVQPHSELKVGVKLIFNPPQPWNRISTLQVARKYLKTFQCFQVPLLSFLAPRFPNLEEVMLSAAFSRLVKTARRWFDYSTGSVNSSWIVFITVIINRFKRKILFGVVLQKVEA
ncbi:hypothetical protein RF55_6536 [Lasius niger]|uniref:Uncharacterized protein n=1 Tax=Lasius niger TaxID=67767 RepID=A0A0J7KT03_LASNI|nr:hypothetical protein RF55_6536 [Lasius niger]